MEPMPTALLSTTTDAGAGLTFTLETLMDFLGRLHPAVVHFPIALILTAVLFETIAAVRRGDRRSTLALQCLALGAAAAAFAAWFGWISAEKDPYGRSVAQTLFIHRWSGVAAAGLAVIALIAALFVREGRPAWAMRAYRGALLLSGACIAVGGYMGGELVHGGGHLLQAFRPAPPAPVRVATPRAPAATPAAGGAELVSFESQVKPILDEHCVHCHGQRRQRGRLRLDDMAFVFEGPETDWVVRPGDPEASELVARIILPEDDPDLMPADDLPLPAEHVELIRTWIEQGATYRASGIATTGQQEPEQETAPPADPPAATAAVPDEFGVGLTTAQRDARDAALARIVARDGIAAPVTGASQAVDVNLSLADPPFGDSDLSLLAGLEPSLVWLDLSRSAITDAGLATLAGFTRLRRLRLDNTAVTDAGLAHLVSLGELRSLNLYGTAVTDDVVAHLTAMPALERVYLWSTQVSRAGGDALRAARPELAVDLGAPLPPPEPEPAEGEPVAFETAILPILQEHCVHCHGPERMRMDLRLDSHDLVMKGSEGGPVVVAGNAAGSSLLARIILPADDPDLMPADGDPLPRKQVALIRAWIEQGAEP
jgi:uncharacterized membrane protein